MRMCFFYINIEWKLKLNNLALLLVCPTQVSLGFQSKIDNSMFDSEMETDSYNIPGFDRNRHGGGVACYIINDLRWLVGLNLIQLEQQKTQLPFIILAKKLRPILCRVVTGV